MGEPVIFILSLLMFIFVFELLVWLREVVDVRLSRRKGRMEVGVIYRGKGWWERYSIVWIEGERWLIREDVWWYWVVRRKKIVKIENERLLFLRRSR